MNSIKSRLAEIKRLTEANRKDASELREITDFTTWLMFMASTMEVPLEGLDADAIQRFTASDAAP